MLNNLNRVSGDSRNHRSINGNEQKEQEMQKNPFGSNDQMNKNGYETNKNANSSKFNYESNAFSTNPFSPQNSKLSLFIF